MYPAGSIATGIAPETIRALARDMGVLASFAAKGTFNHPLGTVGTICIANLHIHLDPRKSVFLTLREKKKKKKRRKKRSG